MSAFGGAPHGAPPAFAPDFSPHAHAADLGALTILLDLKRDRYLAAPSGLLARLHEEEGKDAEADALRSRLKAEGILSETDQRHDWLGFWRACAWAGRAVASRRLDRAVREIRRVRRQMGTDAPARAFAAAFEEMRPWYPRRVVCLFDSLALMSFLSRRGARGELVFGVRGMPFSAHCWVEDRGAPLNDEPAYCASFRPILRV